MKLRSGKFIQKLLPKENQPFKLICLDEKIKDRDYGNPNVKLYRAWGKWVHYVNTR